MRITFLLWNGDIGGAERVTVSLAGELRRMAVDAAVVFVRGPERLAGQLAAEAVPHASLGLPRGVSVMLHPAKLRAALHALRPDVVVTVRVGYLGAALRASGFRGPIIGVEHGELLETVCGPKQLVKKWPTRALGVVTHDAEVAVSHYMRDLVLRRLHAKRVVLIPHGVDTGAGAVGMPVTDADVLTVGYVGRLCPGKGVDRLIAAIAELRKAQPGGRVKLRVAGDGEMRAPWAQLARGLGVAADVEFVGWTDDVRRHWASCHIAAAPNDSFIESFGMSVIEAMAAGRATLVTDRGALPELVTQGQTGQIVTAGDSGALASALAAYVRDPTCAVIQGAAARRRAVAHYTLISAAQKYLALGNELLSDTSSTGGRGFA